MEEEFLTNQERLRPQEERNQEDRTKVPFVLLILLLLLYFWLLDAGCFLPLLVQVLDTVVGRCRSFWVAAAALVVVAIQSMAANLGLSDVAASAVLSHWLA